MTTFAQLTLAQEAHRNLENLRRDILANAINYPTRSARGQSLEGLVGLIASDASEYQRRLKWHATLLKDPALTTDLEAGFAAMSLDPAEHLSILAELQDAADFQMASAVPLSKQTKVPAVVITSPDDIASVGSTLADLVPEHAKLFGLGDDVSISIGPSPITPEPPK